MKVLDRNDFRQFDSHLYENQGFTKNKPKVSICLITYNQENFIGNALDSILEQKVNFDYEIVIGDDCSTDSNAEIIKSYLTKHPDKIRAYLHPYNLGPKNCPSKNNFLHAFFNCNGQYIVHIEGDDYFTDPNKLQLQADYLDKNPELSCCFHNATIKWEDWNDRPDELVNTPNQKEITTIDDLLVEKETWFMATASVMMRRKLVHPLPKWFEKTVSGDIPLYIILANIGNIGYIDRNMSVYRKNLAGQSFVFQLSIAKFLKNRIEVYKNLNKHTNYKYKEKFEAILADYYSLLPQSSDYKKNIFMRTYYSFIHIYYAKQKPTKAYLKDTLRTLALQENALNKKNIKRWLYNDIFDIPTK